ncbi:MAG: hypothetical protein WAX89_04465 [Alphaproteobacteria bacterium]
MTITKNIICMKWGTRYGPEYVNRLYSMVQRNLTPPYRFVCITDDPTGLMNGIECKPIAPLNEKLPAHLKNKPWLKLLVWANPLYDLVGQALFIDVDVVITGNLDDFFTFEPTQTFVAIENWTELGKNTANTSVFRFDIGAHPYILSNFEADIAGTYAAHKIEQRYISRTISQQTFWPKAWCRSFKEELLPPLPFRWWQAPKLPADARIVIFHGKPDPDEALRGEWPVKQGQWWKKIYKTLPPTVWVGEHWR